MTAPAEVTLRPYCLEDIAAVAQYANNQKIACNLRDAFPYPYTLEDAEWFVQDCIRKEGQGQAVRAILADGAFAGSVGLFLQQDVARFSCELGYWLAEPFWGGGIMTKAVCEMTEYAFSVLRLTRVYAQPFAYNTASERVLQKAGFEREGVLKKSVYKNGVFYDSILYARVRETL